MYPRPFTYLRPSSAAEALAQLAEHGSEARPLAGGMSLVPLLKYRQLSPRVLVDIGRLRELAGIRVVDGVLRIGATTRHYEVADWDWDASLAAFGELAGRIGDTQVRSMGTAGGGLAAVEPSGDWGTALLAMRGEVVAAASGGERHIAADDFFVGSGRSALRPDELLTQAWFPLPAGRFGTAAVKFEARRGAPLASCAALVAIDDDGRVSETGLACTGIDGFPVRLAGAEAVLSRQPFGPDMVSAAAEAAREAAPDRFRGALIARLAGDALRLAGRRAQQHDGKGGR
jgi:aerobic carbon-monoxide dehydrogenase medium subunit